MKHGWTSVFVFAWVMFAVSSVKAEALPWTQINERLKPAGGLAVVVAPGSLAEAEAIRADGRFATAALVSDAKVSERFREQLAEAGHLGEISVLTCAALERLPFADETVGLLALPEGVKIDQAEIDRVVRAGGVSVKQTGDGWDVSDAQPRRDGEDDWSHYNYDSTSNNYSSDRLVGPPTHVRWMANGRDRRSSGISMRLIGGYCVMASDRQLAVRDARTGVLLWRKEMDGIELRNRYTLVADEQRIYAHLRETTYYIFTVPQKHMVAFDIATGEKVLTYDQGFEVPYGTTRSHGREIRSVKGASRRGYTVWNDTMAVVREGVLLQTGGDGVFALDAATGKRLWAWRSGKDPVSMPTIIDGRAYVVVGPGQDAKAYTHWPAFQTERILCFDLKSGKRRWTWTWKGDGNPVAYNMVGSDVHNRLALAVRMDVKQSPGGMIVLDATTGEQVFAGVPEGWERGEYGGGHSHLRTMFADGRLMVGSMFKAIAFDPESPPKRKDTSWSWRPRGCSVWRATPGQLVYLTSLVKMDGSDAVTSNVARTGCDIGSIPANGALYLTSNTNCGCFSYIIGSLALSSDRLWERPFKGERLQRGPGQPAAPTADDAWGHLGRDAAHTAWADKPVSGKPAQQWATQIDGIAMPTNKTLAWDWSRHPHIAGPVVGPTVAGEHLIAALSHRGVVIGLDTATGRELWRTPVEGAIDSAPTISDGVVLAGTRAGWVYALSPTDGKLIWRFRAAPTDGFIVDHGQVASAWPLNGSVRVVDGDAWVFAGRSAEADGGIWWWQLDARTGTVRSSGRIGRDNLPDLEALQHDGRTEWDLRDHPGLTIGMNQPPIRAGDYLYMHNIRLNMKTGKAASFDSKPDVTDDFDALIPGQFGLAAWGFNYTGLNAHSMTYGNARGRHIAHRGGLEFVATFASTHTGGRGGNYNRFLVTRGKRHPNDTAPDARLRDVYADLVWGAGNSGRRDNIDVDNCPQALAVAGTDDKNAVVIVARTKPNRHEPHTLILTRYRDGKPLTDVELPGMPIYNGMAVSNGRIFVVTDAGQLVCVK